MLPSHCEIGELDLELLGIGQRVGDHAGIEGGDDGAVLVGRAIEVAHGREAAGARHVLHDDVRLAGDVVADVAAERAGVEVVAAARREADDNRDRLAGVEGVVLRGGRSAGGEACSKQREQCYRANSCADPCKVIAHDAPPFVPPQSAGFPATLTRRHVGGQPGVGNSAAGAIGRGRRPVASACDC